MKYTFIISKRDGVMTYREAKAEGLRRQKLLGGTVRIVRQGKGFVIRFTTGN